jgi:5-methylcytosine-specific restriction endonuclease McrA
VKLSKEEREKLRMKFGGCCAYCGCELPEKGWHADHVKAVRREWYKSPTKTDWTLVDGKLTGIEVEQEVGFERPENDTIENMFPACAPCNLDKHAMPLEDWRRAIANKVDVCRYDSAFRHAERFGLIEEIKKPVSHRLRLLTLSMQMNCLPPEKRKHEALDTSNTRNHHRSDAQGSRLPTGWKALETGDPTCLGDIQASSWWEAMAHRARNQDIQKRLN